jgi:hypothetical protein
MVRLSPTQQAAKDKEDARRQAIIDAGGDPDAPEHQPHAVTAAAGADDAASDRGTLPVGNWLALTDAASGQMTLLDATAITHIAPGQGSRPNPNPKLQANHGNVIGPVTEIGTIGGTIIRVLEEVGALAQMMGLHV